MFSEIKELKRQEVLSKNSDVDNAFYAGVKIDDGFTYAVYECPVCSAIQVSNKGEMMYCAVCGEESKFMADIPIDGIVSDKISMEDVTCPICNTAMVTSRKIGDDLHCVQCGGEITTGEDDLGLEVEDEEEEAEKIKAEEEEEEVAAKASSDETGIPIGPIDESTTYAKSSIRMVLHDAAGDNPYWNVILNGMPTARILLKDQPNPDEIRDVFASDLYAENLSEAIEKLGAKPVLDQIKAKYYVNMVSTSELSQQLKEEIQTEADVANKEALAKLKENYSDCIKLVLAGLRRNFFPDVDNPLKATLWSALEKNGVVNPTDVIESCFEESADKFFDIVLLKAESYMGKDPEVREEISKAIRDGDTILPAGEGHKDGDSDDESLSNRLVKSSVDLDLLGGVSFDKGKETIKTKLQLGRKV